jgi:hypothetical protein
MVRRREKINAKKKLDIVSTVLEVITVLYALCSEYSPGNYDVFFF